MAILFRHLGRLSSWAVFGLGQSLSYSEQIHRVKSNVSTVTWSLVCITAFMLHRRLRNDIKQQLRAEEIRTWGLATWGVASLVSNTWDHRISSQVFYENFNIPSLNFKKVLIHYKLALRNQKLYNFVGRSAEVE